MKRLWLCLIASLFSLVAQADTVRIAVAANFKQTVDKLIAAYDDKSTAFTVSAGATGMLYAQIVQGAPFDLFFSADVERPQRLEADGRTVAGSRFIYASGQVVLWAPRAQSRQSIPSVLRSAKVVAIAEPKIAPYGAAAEQALSRLGFAKDLPFKLVNGESIGQTFQFIATGHADVGFIARSQVEESPDAASLREQILAVDPKLHDPLDQAVVVLESSQNKAAATRFLNFVRSERGRRIIAAAGYSVTTAK